MEQIVKRILNLKEQLAIAEENKDNELQAIIMKVYLASQKQLKFIEQDDTRGINNLCEYLDTFLSSLKDKPPTN